MKDLTAIHIVDNYLINPTNQLTVNLIGAGGTGSKMLTALGTTNESLLALGHTGFHLNVFDPDVVTKANIGRQLFGKSEVGMNKAVALVNRANRFWGTNWKAITQPFGSNNVDRLPNRGKANIYITCVDTVAARFDIASVLKGFIGGSRYERNRPMYWMDMGNSRYTGQVILSTIGEVAQPNSKQYRTVPFLPMVTDEFRQLLEAQTDNNEPSCSLPEALEKQDLHINAAIADLGASLLWQMLREGMTENRGFFVNVKEFRMQPLKVA